MSLKKLWCKSLNFAALARSKCIVEKWKGSGFSRQCRTREQTLALLVLKEITCLAYFSVAMKAFWLVNNRKQHFKLFFSLCADHSYCVPAHIFFFTNTKCSAELDFFELFCSGRYSATHFVSVGLYVLGRVVVRCRVLSLESIWEKFWNKSWCNFFFDSLSQFFLFSLFLEHNSHKRGKIRFF